MRLDLTQFMALILSVAAAVTSTPPMIGPDGRYVSTDKPPAVSAKSDSVPVATKPEVLFYSAPWCTKCKPAKNQLIDAQAKGKLPFVPVFVESDKDAPAWVDKFPTTHWGDGETVEKSKTKFIISGWTGVDDLVARFNLSRKPKAVAKKLDPETVAKTEPDWDRIAKSHTTVYIEFAHGLTRPVHLDDTHKVPPEVIEKYRSDQEALNRIHAYCHETGR